MTGEAPWTRKNLVVTATIAGIGGLLCVVSWFRVSGESASHDQMGMLNVSVVGLALVGLGYAQWFLTGRRTVGVRRRLLLTPTPTAEPVGILSSTVTHGASRRSQARAAWGRVPV